MSNYNHANEIMFWYLRRVASYLENPEVNVWIDRVAWNNQSTTVWLVTGKGDQGFVEPDYAWRWEWRVNNGNKESNGSET